MFACLAPDDPVAGSIHRNLRSISFAPHYVCLRCAVLTPLLAQNGQEILDSLSELKPTLVDRHERWVARYGADDPPHPSPGRSTPGHRRPRYDDPHSPAREAEHQRARTESMRYYEEQQRLEALREEARRRQYEYDHHDDYADQRDDERHREFLRARGGAACGG